MMALKRCVVLVLVCGCVVASRHAEVRLANNPAGADCFARCAATTEGPASVDCVAACPAAIHDSGDCDGGGVACVEHRRMRKGLVTWMIIGGAVTTLLVAAAASSSASSNGGPQ